MTPLRARLLRLVGPVLLASIGVFAIHGSIGLGLWRGDIPGPGLYPLICSAILTGLCLLAVLVEIVRHRPPEIQGEPMLWLRLGLYVVSLLVFAVLIEPLGFMPTSVLALMLAMRAGEGRPWSQSLVISLAGSVAIWFLFDRLLGVPLPAGVLAGIL